jgi:hypothetical protein
MDIVNASLYNAMVNGDEVFVGYLTSASGMNESILLVMLVARDD